MYTVTVGDVSDTDVCGAWTFTDDNEVESFDKELWEHNIDLTLFYLGFKRVGELTNSFDCLWECDVVPVREVE